MTKLSVNGENHTLDTAPKVPLLRASAVAKAISEAWGKRIRSFLLKNLGLSQARA